MCSGDTITIEVSAVNHGIADLTNATQVLEAVQQGHATARVIGVEHWDPGWALSPDPGVGALCLLVIALLAPLFVFFVFAVSQKQESGEENP